MDMELFTKKVGSLTVAFLTAIGAVVLILGFAFGAMVYSGSAQAQEVLEGKFPVVNATCSVDKHYVIKKGNPIQRPCILFADFASEEDTAWVLIFNQYGEAAVVVEITSKGDQRIVWRKGQLDNI